MLTNLGSGGFANPWSGSSFEEPLVTTPRSVIIRARAIVDPLLPFPYGLLVAGLVGAGTLVGGGSGGDAIVDPLDPLFMGMAFRDGLPWPFSPDMFLVESGIAMRETLFISDWSRDWPRGATGESWLRP